MFRFIVFADLHAHTFRRYACLNEAGNNSRLQVALDVLAYVRKIAVAHQVRYILFAGDLFDNKGKVPVIVINAVFRELEKFVAHGLEIFMVPGNHDYAVRSGKEHSLEVFSTLRGVTVFKSPTQLRWGFEEGCVYITAVPFADQMKQEWFEVDPVLFRRSEVSLCLVHGAVEHSKYTETFSTEMLPESERSQVIPQPWLDKYTFCVAGHVHYPAIMGAKSNILVPGQPWHLHSHEASQKRGIWLVEIEVGGKPTFTLFEPPTPCFLNAQVEDTGEVILYGGTTVKGHIVMLQPAHASVPDSVLQAAREILIDQGSLYVELLRSEDGRSDLAGYAPRMVIDPNSSPTDVLAKVLHSGLVDLGGFAPEELTGLGNSLLKEASLEDNE